MNQKFESEQYRSGLAEKLINTSDKQKRQEVLKSEKESPEYKDSREAIIVARKEKVADKNKEKELIRDNERSEFIKKVQELKADFEKQIEQANNLVRKFYHGFSGDIKGVAPVESFEIIKEQIKFIDENKFISGSHYISQMSRILLQIEKLEIDTEAEVETLSNSVEQLKNKIAEIQAQVNNLKKQGILKRLISYAETNEDERLIKNMSNVYLEKNKNLEIKKQDLANIKAYKSYGRREIIEAMTKEMNRTVNKKIERPLAKLCDKITGDNFIAEDIGKQYIKEIISPVFDKVIKQREEWKAKGIHYSKIDINEKIKNNFFSKLEKYLKIGDEADRVSVEDMIRDFDFPSELSSVCQPLLYKTGPGGRKSTMEITSFVFEQYAMGKIYAGVDNLKNEKRKLRSLSKINEMRETYDIELSHAVDENFYIQFRTNFDKLPDDIKSKIYTHSSYSNNFLSNLPLWAAARNTPLMGEAFGKDIETLDQKYYEKILPESLYDNNGSFIDALYYFPKPDSIKTLVLLAAADRREYRTVHAESTLANLKETAQWPEILNEAEKKYPQLKKVRQVLENWKADETNTNNYPELKKIVDDLAVYLLENENDNWRQEQLAIEALSNGKIISLLNSGKQISDEDKLYIEELNLMFETNENSDYRVCNLKALIRGLLIQSQQIISCPDDEINYLSFASEQQLKKELSVITAISKTIVEDKKNVASLEYLSSASVNDKIKLWVNSRDSKKTDFDINLFIESYKYLPELLKSEILLRQFCSDFNGQKTIEFYKKLYQAVEKNEIEDKLVIIAKIANLVVESKLLPDRAIEILKPIQTSRGEVDFLKINNNRSNKFGFGDLVQEIALNYPDLILENNNGLDFLNYINNKDGIDGLEFDFDSSFGGSCINMAKKEGQDNKSKQFARRVLAAEFENNIKPMFDEEKTPEINKENWKKLMLAFIGITEGFHWARNLQPKAEQINDIFKPAEAKNICLSEMKKIWLAYLEKGKIDELPVSLGIICDYIQEAGGAGPLAQIESFSTFIEAYRGMLVNKYTVERTKTEVIEGIKSAEFRFKKERWSDDDIADFYNISRDVIASAPSMLSSYFDLFKKLKAKDFKEFSQTIFPLHRVILSLLEKRDGKGNKKHDKKDLAKMRRYVVGINNEPGEYKSIEEQRKKLMDLILALFKDKFGIIKVPENLNQENVRSITDTSMYLANLEGRDNEKEDILSFYLALAINGKWDSYRSGDEIKPEEFLAEEKADRVKEYLVNRSKLNPVKAENIGIRDDEMSEFMKILQEESENMAVGNVETVDVKLNNVIDNLEELKDPDLYPDKMDKGRMSLLLEYGNKRVGEVASKMYQQLAKPGKQFEFTDEDEKIKKQIETALINNSLDLNAENVKKYFQMEIKPLAVVVNILHFVEEIGVKEKILDLRNILKPSDDVITVFNKMGEEFKETSGAIAISQDLEYLDNLIVKKAKELNEDEMQLVKSYVGKVREKLILLEDIYNQIENKFTKISQGQTETKNELLKSKLEEISRIINRPQSEQMITSAMTNNLNFIIENMRECLSCVRQGANNDTNLTFGDSNKFYLYSKSNMQAGSISDEIVFFEPVTLSDGSQEMSFVLDKVYGAKTPKVFINQAEVVYKKYEKIKKRFPDAKISILISNSASQSGGISRELLMEKLKENIAGKFTIQVVENVDVDVIKSASGDHYIEFGGYPRTDGKRSVSGVLIK